MDHPVIVIDHPVIVGVVELVEHGLKNDSKTSDQIYH